MPQPSLPGDRDGPDEHRFQLKVLRYDPRSHLHLADDCPFPSTKRVTTFRL